MPGSPSRYVKTARNNEIASYRTIEPSHHEGLAPSSEEPLRQLRNVEIRPQRDVRAAVASNDDEGEDADMSTISTQTETRSVPAKSTVAPTGCCPPFDPETFHEKEITWNAKPFVKERVHSVFHIPLDMGRKVMHAMRLIEEAHAAPAQGLMLSDELSPWKSDLYIDVSGPVAGAEVVTVSGTFLARVYEGPFRDAPKWTADMRAYCAAKGREVRKIYLGYTTCPRCAKAYGKNYVVVFAEVEPRAEALDPESAAT